MNSMARYLVLVNHEKNEYFPEKCACCTLKNYYKTENILHRALRKILLKSQSPFIPVLFSHWYNEIKKVDAIILFDTRNMPEIIRWLRKKFPQKRIVAWYWNSIADSVNPETYKDVKNIEIWSFDKKDCVKYGYQFNTQFYIPENMTRASINDVEHGFNAPVSMGYQTIEDAMADTSRFRLPVIVKPVDSSGSKGATVLHSWDKVNDALEFAFSFSRAHRVIVEEYIEKKHPYLIGGDIFVLNGKVVIWGLLNCHRDTRVNPLVPVGKSYPLILKEADVQLVQQTLQSMMDKLGIRFGSVNVELVVDKNNRVWPIDVGPRAGGNMIPDLLGKIYGADLVEMAVQAAMGQPILTTVHKPEGCYATHNLHSTKNGIYKQIVFSDELKKYLQEVHFYKKPGDHVERFDNAAKCLGIIFMKFPNVATAENILSHMEKHIDVQLTTE